MGLKEVQRTEAEGMIGGKVQVVYIGDTKASGTSIVIDDAITPPSTLVEVREDGDVVIEDDAGQRRTLSPLEILIEED